MGCDGGCSGFPMTCTDACCWQLALRSVNTDDMAEAREANSIWAAFILCNREPRIQLTPAEAKRLRRKKRGRARALCRASSRAWGGEYQPADEMPRGCATATRLSDLLTSNFASPPASLLSNRIRQRHLASSDRQSGALHTTSGGEERSVSHL